MRTCNALGDDEDDDFFQEENIVRMSKENIGLLPPNASDTGNICIII